LFFFSSYESKSPKRKKKWLWLSSFRPLEKGSNFSFTLLFSPWNHILYVFLKKPLYYWWSNISQPLILLAYHKVVFYYVQFIKNEKKNIFYYLNKMCGPWDAKWSSSPIFFVYFKYSQVILQPNFFWIYIYIWIRLWCFAKHKNVVYFALYY
jgi:hypothetical protein